MSRNNQSQPKEKEYGLTEAEVLNITISQNIIADYNAKLNVARAGNAKYVEQIRRKLSIPDGAKIRFDLDIENKRGKVFVQTIIDKKQ